MKYPLVSGGYFIPSEARDTLATFYIINRRFSTAIYDHY